jgi:hypothetical protein
MDGQVREGNGLVSWERAHQRSELFLSPASSGIAPFNQKVFLKVSADQPPFSNVKSLRRDPILFQS